MARPLHPRQLVVNSLWLIFRNVSLPFHSSSSSCHRHSIIWAFYLGHLLYVCFLRYRPQVRCSQYLLSVYSTGLQYTYRSYRRASEQYYQYVLSVKLSVVVTKQKHQLCLLSSLVNSQFAYMCISSSADIRCLSTWLGHCLSDLIV